MKELVQYIQQVIHFSEEELESFTSLFSARSLKKYGFFAQDGEYATKIAFIRTGVMRAFYRNQKGEEYNKTFFTDFTFVGAYSSLVSGQQNLIDIQCLIDCEIYEASFNELRKLYDSIPKFERFARIMAEQFFVQKEKREIELVMLDAAQRYAIFRKEHPGLENLIPQYHIASYLGVTPTQLSRIRAKKT